MGEFSLTEKAHTANLTVDVESREKLFGVSAFNNSYVRKPETGYCSQTLFQRSCAKLRLR